MMHKYKETKEKIFNAYNKTISKAKPAKLKEYGLDFVLAGREGVKVTDTEGRQYFDCYCSGGQQVLGNYRHEVRDAFREALKQYDLGNFILMSAQKAALAKLLSEVAPGNLKHTVFGVGRGEANDFAMKLARGATGRKEIVCFAGGSHGQTGFALSASADPRQEKHFGPLIPGIRRIAPAVDAVEEAVTGSTAAVLVEPIQSDAGVVALPSNLLQAIRAACSRQGAALIVDEGQCAFGRTGLLFECMRHEIQPDILTVAKGMGGTYYPISATIFNSRLNRFMLTHTLIHLSTFGGADLGCMVAIATIEIIRKNRLWDNARVRGAELTKGLQELAAADPEQFAAVRGEGLMLGLQLADAAAAARFTTRLAAKGVIALPTTLNPRVIRFTPPIDITADQTAELLDLIAAAMKDQ